MFCEKIEVIQRSTNTLDEEEYDDREIWKVREDKFSCGETKVCMSPVGVAIAREGPASDSDCERLARQAVFCEFGDVFSADHVRFDTCHPYIDSLPTA